MEPLCSSCAHVPAHTALVCILLGFQVFIFYSLTGNDAATLQAYTTNSYTCWPYFPNCGAWYVLDLSPHSYSQSAFNSGWFLLQIGAFFAVARGRWRLAHTIFALALLWEAVLVGLLSYEAGEAYIYYHLALACVVLFVPSKLWLLRRLVVAFYVIGGFVELHRIYVLSGIPHSLPLIPENMTWWFVNTAIVVSFGAWYLLAHDARYRRAFMLILFVFHVYAGIVFEFPHMARAITILGVLFWDNPSPSPVVRRDLIALSSTLGIVLGIHLWIVVAAGYGSFTFARPHLGIATYFPTTSGVSNAEVTYRDGRTELVRGEWRRRPCRCSPYTRWFELKNRCKDASVSHIAWNLDLALSDGPLQRVIQTSNVCALDFSVLRRNTWITPYSTTYPQ